MKASLALFMTILAGCAEPTARFQVLEGDPVAVDGAKRWRSLMFPGSNIVVMILCQDSAPGYTTVYCNLREVDSAVIQVLVCSTVPTVGCIMHRR